MIDNNYADNCDYSIPGTQPLQKLPDSAKSREWGIQNILWQEQQLVHRDNNIGLSKYQMSENSNLYYYNILNRETVARITNSANVDDFVIPKDFVHYKIEQNKVQTLKGEELSRRFDWKVYVANRDAVSQKDEQKKEQYFQWMSEKIKSESFDQKSAEQELQKLQEYLTYDWKEIRELTAEQLLHYYTQKLDLKTQFSRIWENGIVKSEEIMDVDEYNGRPISEACDPIQMYWHSTRENPYIDDAEEVVRLQYLPLGKVVDYWFDYITPNEISELEEDLANRTMTSNQRFGYNQQYTKDDTNGRIIQAPMLNGYESLPIGAMLDNYYGEWWDEDVNIRVVHCRWKSLRKIGKLKYYDENGDQQIKDVHENYKIDKSLGEEVEWKWINEAWEGTKIGRNIFVKIQPRNCQFRDIDNPAGCSLGYIGTRIDNPIFELMKQYSIMYDMYMWKGNDAVRKTLGDVGVFDLATIPDDMDLNGFIKMIQDFGFVIEDSFKESKKGASQGKLAGSMSGRANSMKIQQYELIKMCQEKLNYIDMKLDSLIGINPQRQGQVSPDAGLQVTKDAVQYSSNITESYFALHDNVKLRTLRALLEVCKYCMKEKNETIQYITTAQTTEIFNVDGPSFNEASYGLLIGDAKNDEKLISSMQKAVEIGLQTGAVDLIEMMDVFSTETTSSIRRKIEKSVRQKQENEQKNAEAERELIDKQREHDWNVVQQQLDDKDLDRDLKEYEINLTNQTKLDIAEMTALAIDEGPNAEAIDNTAEIAHKQNELSAKTFNEQQKIQHEKDKHKKDVELKEKEIAQKDREMKDKKEIENKKIEAIKVQNRSQELINQRQIKLKEKELVVKERVEKFKVRNKPKPTKK